MCIGFWSLGFGKGRAFWYLYNGWLVPSLYLRANVLSDAARVFEPDQGQAGIQPLDSANRDINYLTILVGRYFAFPFGTSGAF